MKISVVGAGNVGASIAYALCMRELCDEIALVDIFGDVARAKAIDLAQSSCVFNAKTSVCGGDDFVLIEGSDIVIVTAGSPRKEGQTREDLLLKNAVVVKQTAQKIAEFAKNAVIIVVTNPLDVMVWTAHKFSGFSKSKVVGMAGELDSARCRYELALFWAREMAKSGGILSAIFANLADELEKNEGEILKQIRENDGASAEFGGYYLPDEAKANEVMRPSEILNKIIG